LKGVYNMKFKRVLLPFITGALALSLAACGEDDKAAKDAKAEKAAQAEMESAEEMQAKLAEQQVEKDKIVAIVNDEELKGEQYNATLTSIQGQMQQMGQDPSNKESAEQAKKQALDTVVNQTLILQKAKEEKITASETEIDEKYAEFVEQFGDEETMKEALKSQSVDVNTVREQIIAKSIIFEKYQDKFAPAEEVTDKEIEEYYDQAAAQSKDSGQELPPLEEVSDEIKEMIEQEQQQKQLAAHVEKLKADAEIELKI
jgi:FKBP-type peptidyl-prolyl cis-trans isomerase (trigger factor)